MKAFLYAAKGTRLWEWRVSLDIEADFTYWFGQFGAETRIRLFEPSLSFGQVCALLPSLERERTSLDAGQIDMLRIVSEHATRLLSPSVASMIQAVREIDFASWRRAGKPLMLDQCEYTRFVAFIRGRSLLPEELSAFYQTSASLEMDKRPHGYIQMAYLDGRLSLQPAIRIDRRLTFPFVRKKPIFICERCGSTDSMVWTACTSCGMECPYCEACLTLGRAKRCTPVIVGAEPERTEDRAAKDIDECLAPWGLSDVQAEASREALTFLSARLEQSTGPSSAPGCFLIWAVTGAGKTEMIFPLIQYELSRGGRALVTTPRKDVVLELEPRLKKAFPQATVVTLYGGSEQKWESGSLTIATTHQLMRFSGSFDLVIIDEIDAFPYHNNPMLEYAARKAVKKSGSYIFLSATPPEPLQQAVNRGRVGCARVPARFHRHPLPVPQLVTTHPLGRLVRQQRLPAAFQHSLTASVSRGAQIFVFVPNIKLVAPTVDLLRRCFPAIIIEGTSSKDEDRASKVVQFREKRIRLLVTTTILERGVTIPKSDVYILDADSGLFDAAALIQMAGRAGRSKDDPAGKVIFAASSKTASQIKAVRQIKQMNKLAKRKGFLITK